MSEEDATIENVMVRALQCYKRYWGDSYCEEKCGFLPFCKEYTSLRFRMDACPCISGYLKFVYQKIQKMANLRAEIKIAKTLQDSIQASKEYVV